MTRRVAHLHTGDLGREQRWWAGVLHAGLANGATREAGNPTAALCGLSAAGAGGPTGFETSVVHVLVAHGRETQDLAVTRRTLPGRALLLETIDDAARRQSATSLSRYRSELGWVDGRLRAS